MLARPMPTPEVPPDPRAPRDVARLLARAVERFGEAPFLVVGDERLSFAAFGARVATAAAAFAQRGVGPGDRVAVLLPRCVDEAVALLGAMAAGGVAVPVHGKLKDDQVRHVLRDAEPRCVVTNRTRTLALRDAAALFEGLDVLDAPRDLAAPGTLRQSDAGASGDASRQEPRGLPGAPIDPGTAAVLLYTSGSTGPAKAVVQTHGNLARGAEVVAGYLELTAADHVLALLPLSFDYGLNQLLSALWVGCQLTAADHLGAAELAALLRRHRPTGLAGVPSLWHEVAGGLDAGSLTDDDGRSLRYVTNSGGALRIADSRRLRLRWPHVAVYAMYGLTEAFRSAFLPPGEFDAHPESFGYAIEGVELLLVCPDDGAVLDGAATGELVHAGELVAAGYWRRPADTAARFRPDPRGGGGTVVYSGDLVRRDAGGRHYFVARQDRMLKVFGHRVSPDEVAAAVADMPGVGQLHVAGLDGGADGHRIALWLVGDPADGALADAVRRRCRARLPSYMVPQVVQVVPRLPHTANGKVDEAVLRALLEPCREGP